MEKLNDEQVDLLVKHFIALNREYEQFRRDCHIMESPLQMICRHLEEDLLKKGYES